MEEDPSTLLTPTLTATNSDAFSPAKRPYHSRDDTLPSPPPPPLCSYEVPGVLHSAPFARSLSRQWMSPENTGVAEWDEHDSERKLLDAEGRSTIGSSIAQLHWQHRQAAVLTSLASAEDSMDAAMFSMLAGGDGSKVSPAEPPPTSETPGGALLHTPEAATMTRERDEAVSHQLSQPFPMSALTTSREATPQQSDLLPRCSTTASPSTAKFASGPTSGSISPETRCISSVARAALSTVKLNLQVEAPKLRLQQTAERAATSQVALLEEARMENEVLRQQLGALLLIQEELERRCQQREAATARAEKRHESEIKVLELEKEQALAQLRESYEEQLQALRDAEVAAQSNVDALAKQVVTLRRQLSVTQEELRASLEEQLECQRQSDETISRQARIEAECIASQSAAADAQAKVTAQLSELRRKLWATQERAGAAELALQSLCSQLTAAAENTLAGASAGADVEVEENCKQDETADAKPAQCYLTSKNFKGAESTKAPVVFDEAAVLSAVLSVMEDNGISTTVPSPLRSSPEMRGKETVERSPSSSTCTSMEKEALFSQDQLTAPLLPPSADTCSAPIRAHLSKAGRLRCRQHQELIQSVLAHVSDAYQQVARRCATDARLCAVEHVLFKEIKEWRERLDEHHQRLPSNERVRQDDSHTHGGDAAGCQAPHSISTRRCSVGVVTDAVDSFNVHVTKAAAASAALQREETGAKAAYEEILAESQRQLRYERSYIVQLQNEIQSLRTSNNAATVLESLTNTLQNLRVAVCRLVRDAVADMQRLFGQRSQRIQAAATNIGGFASEMVFREETGQLLRRRWRSMHEADTHHLKNSSSAGETDSVTCETIALPSSPLLDFAFARAVHKSVLRAETLLEKVSTTLLRENGRVFADAHAFFGAYKEDQGSACATCPPTRSHMMSFSARDAVQDSWSEANRACREVSSHRVAEEGGTSYRGDVPLVSPSTASSAATGNRTAHQQKVYAEMRDLLQRSATSHYDVPAPAVSASPHSRDEPLWLLGDRPQQARPSGMNVSPTPQRSPYVAAYFTGPAEYPRVASSYVLLDSAEAPAAVVADARLGFAQLADAMQELRNVGRVLDNIRDAEETREEKWQQCLQHWQGAILEAVDGVRERIESALTLLRRPEVEGVVAGDTMNNETSAHVTSTLKAISRGICAHSVCDELERAPGRQRVPRSVSQEMKSPAVPPHGPSRLAEVLSGKMRSKVDEAALLSA